MLIPLSEKLARAIAANRRPVMLEDCSGWKAPAYIIEVLDPAHLMTVELPTSGGSRQTFNRQGCYLSFTDLSAKATISAALEAWLLHDAHHDDDNRRAFDDAMDTLGDQLTCGAPRPYDRG